MRILFLTDNFPPETNAPANRTWDHARQWVRLGHKVTVITSAPNFPVGKVFQGYRNRLFQTETMEGIKVVRVWTYMAPNQGFLRRTIDQASFMVSSLLASFGVRQHDVVVATSPQFFTAIAGWFAAKLKRMPFVFELRDLWPESIVAVGAMRNRLALRLLTATADFLYRQADLIVPVTQTFRRFLIDRGIADNKICVITNGADPNEISAHRSVSETRSRYGLPPDKFVVAYIGTHGLAQGLTTVLDAAARTRTDRSIHYVFMGEGAEKHKLISLAEERQLQNITFIDGQPRQEAFELLVAADATLVLVKDSPVFRTVIPSKLFESMVLRRPIILGVEGESRAIVVDQCRCGLAFTPGDADGLVDAVRKLQTMPALRRQLGVNGARAVEEHFQRDRLADRMVAAMQDRIAPIGLNTRVAGTRWESAHQPGGIDLPTTVTARKA